MKVMKQELIDQWVDEAKDGGFAECEIEWLDDHSRSQVTIKLDNNENVDEDFDTLIFFTCANAQEFSELFDSESGEDFYIVDVYDISPML